MRAAINKRKNAANAKAPDAYLICTFFFDSMKSCEPFKRIATSEDEKQLFYFDTHSDTGE